MNAQHWLADAPANARDRHASVGVRPVPKFTSFIIRQASYRARSSYRPASLPHWPRSTKAPAEAGAPACPPAPTAEQYAETTPTRGLVRAGAIWGKRRRMPPAPFGSQPITFLSLAMFHFAHGPDFSGRMSQWSFLILGVTFGRRPI